jgi:FkbM family methyltransferase
LGKRKKRHIPQIDLMTQGFLPEFVTYAQNFEDVMLRRALPDIANGFYIDVGACHPIADNVSWWFYQNGWTGINVEPNEKFFTLLAAERPRDVNLPFAITGKAGTAVLYLHDALSTIRDDIVAVHRQNGLDMSRTAQVEAITLDQIFENYVRSRTVDFLKLDVEGSEGEILTSTSFERTRPRILVVEATKPDTQVPTWDSWEPGLLKNGYLLVWFDGLNRFYVREEDRWRRKFFKTPPNVFDRVKFAPDDPRIKFTDGHSVEALCLARDAAQQQVSALSLEREQLAAKAAAVQRELEFAQADVSRRMTESDRLASVSGHLERALSTALDALWKSNGETKTLILQKVEAEGELQAVRSESSRLSRERDAFATSKIHAEGELEAVRSENSRLVAERIRAEEESQAARSEKMRLVAERDKLTIEIARHQAELRERAGFAAERDALAAEKSRIERELEAVRSERSHLLTAHQIEKTRLERELETARRDDSHLGAERDKLTVEIARYQIKQRAHGDLAAERDRLAAENARWFDAAVAAAYARRSQPGGSVRHLKLTITASGRRLRCSVSRSRWERGPRMSLALADRALNERQWQLAARCYADVLEQWPNNAAVWVQFGHAVKESGKVAEAEAAYRQAIQLDPAVADPHLQLGHALKLQGRTGEAAEAYAAALRLDPKLQHAADELIALGWTQGEVGSAQSHSRPINSRVQNSVPRGRFARLAFQRMFQ